MAKVGRPTKYTDTTAEQARKYCLLGADDSQLAEMFEVNVDTINEWKKVHPEFSDSIKRGKKVADAEVASSLYHRALGYSHPEEKIFCNDGQIVRANTVKQYPPEPVAAIFWLKNRKSDEWRDKHEVSGELSIKTLVVKPDAKTERERPALKPEFGAE